MYKFFGLVQLSKKSNQINQSGSVECALLFTDLLKQGETFDVKLT